MKKMLLTIGAAVVLAGVPFAAVSAQGFGYHHGETQATHSQLSVQDQTQDRDQLRLHDGTGTNHAECDGTPGDMHRYGATD